MTIIDLITLFLNYGGINAFDEVKIGKDDLEIDSIEVDEDDNGTWVRLIPKGEK